MVTVSGHILRETDMALRFAIGTTVAWLPKSQIEIMARGIDPNPRQLCEAATLRLPDALAREKGFTAAPSPDQEALL